MGDGADSWSGTWHRCRCWDTRCCSILMGELCFIGSVSAKKEGCAESQYCNECQCNTNGDNDQSKIAAFLWWWRGKTWRHSIALSRCICLSWRVHGTCKVTTLERLHLGNSIDLFLNIQQVLKSFHSFVGIVDSSELDRMDILTWPE